MENEQNKVENQFEKEKGGDSSIRKFLKFDSFITPSIIKFIYILGVIFFALSGLILVITGLGSHGGGILALGGIILIALSPFIPRVIAEILIINFKILEVLQDINKKK